MTPITWKCTLVGTRREAERYVLDCAQDGIPVRLFADAR